jgi:hypothetical protein
VSTTASESVPLPLPASLAVVLTLLSNPLPADTVPAAPTEPAVVPIAAAEAMLAHGSAESGGGDEPDAPEQPAVFVSPFAGPNPVEALERLRLFGPGSETDTAPPPLPGPRPAEPAPVPRSSLPAAVPPDLVWADVSWLDDAVPASVGEGSWEVSDTIQDSMAKLDANRPVEMAPVPALPPVSPSFALLGLLPFQESWRRWGTEEDGRSVNRAGRSQRTC